MILDEEEHHDLAQLRQVESELGIENGGGGGGGGEKEEKEERGDEERGVNEAWDNSIPSFGGSEIKSNQQQQQQQQQLEKSDGSEEGFCRVCRCKGTPTNPLRHPCKCKGSVKWIHEECLGEWLKHSRKYECELCGYKYSFKKEYTTNAPENLSIREIADDLVEKLGKNALSGLLFVLNFLFSWVIDPFLSSWTLHMFLEIDFHISTGKYF